MPEIINCPECNRAVSLPERLIGKTVRCPSCKATFIAESPVMELEVVEEDEAPRPAAPKSARCAVDEEEADDRPRRRRDEEDEDEDERPRRSRRRTVDEQDDDEDEEYEDARPRRRKPRFRDANVQDWEKVQLGLILVLAGFSVAFVACLVLTIGSYSEASEFVLSRPRRGEPGDGASRKAVLSLVCLFTGGAFDNDTGRTFLWICCLLGVLLAAGLTVAGDAFCLVVPKDKNARSTALSSLVMTVLGLLVYLGGSITAYIQFDTIRTTPPTGEGQSTPSTIGMVFAIFGLAILLGQPLVFMLFLRRVAATTRNQGLAIGGILAIIIGAVAVLIFVVAAMFLYNALRGVLDAAYVVRGDVGVEESSSLGKLLSYMAFFLCLAVAVWNLAALVLARLAISGHIRRIE